MPSNSKYSSYARPATTIAGVLILWWALTAFEVINPLFLPPLGKVGLALSELSATGIYWDAFTTTYRAVLGLVISVLVAVPVGLIMGRNASLYQYIELPADFFRSIPSSALFFLFILIFGIGDASKIAVVFYGCSLILLVNAVYGARPTREKQDRINMLRSFGATNWQIFRLAVIPDALPHIAAGIRVCASLSLVLVIVTEMFLGASSGLGKVIYDAYLAYRIPQMYVVIIVLGLLGFAINKFCVLLERRATFWQPNQASS